MKPEELIGKTVICGIVFIDKYSETDIRKSFTDFYGEILSISEETGIVVGNHDIKKQISLPPCFEAFVPAKKGVYMLQNGELKVENPDLICEITINRELAK